MLGRAGVNDRRPTDKQDFLARRTRLTDRFDNVVQAERLGLFARDVRAHESERSAAARSLNGQHAHAFMPDDDGHCQLDVGHGNAPRGRLLEINHDAAIHLLVGHLDPAAADPDLGGLIGGAVKPFGKCSRHVGRGDVGVGRVHRRGAMLDQVAQNGVQFRRR